MASHGTWQIQLTRLDGSKILVIRPRNRKPVRGEIVEDQDEKADQISPQRRVRPSREGSIGIWEFDANETT